VARPNIAFLNDLVQSIGASVRRKSSGSSARNAPDLRLAEACARLMRRSGEASRIYIAELALEDYAQLDRAGKARFFHLLLEEYGADQDAIRECFAAWDASPSEAGLVALFEAVEPKRQTLLRRLNLAPGGTLKLVRMREDLLAVMREDAALIPLDSDFAHLFASWFNRGFLEMRRIDWDTSASILEKIVAYEAVHEIRDWDDLRRRLDPRDRRCYGFFHPATGSEPLIFVEVALCRDIPDAIAPLLSARENKDPDEANTAVFYSISNCQPGLKGVSFGNFLIKQVVQDLSRDLPHLETYVTLSPAPGFAAWLAGQTAPEAHALRQALETGTWRDDAKEQDRLRADVEAWAARYFIEAKSSSGAPLDPVSRFHLGNGASAHRINWPADLAPHAIRRAHGLMINYLYEPEAIEAQHEAFVSEGTIAYSSAVRAALKAAPAPAD
jgi:malonyl-CoA decarboxylase